MDLPAKKLKFLEQAFSTPNHNGNLYNTENDKPVDDRPMVETGANQKVVDEKRLEHTKVGNEVQYMDTNGIVVKREGEYLTVYNKDHDAHEQIHISDTYFKDDVIMNVEAQLWDKINFDARINILGKANIRSEQATKDFVHRDWFDLPESLRDVIKSSEAGIQFAETPHGGFAGREQGFNDKTQESESWRDLTNNPHVASPYKDKTPDGLEKDLEGSSAAAIIGGHKGEDEKDDKDEKKFHDEAEEEKKSDVEHGVYGGVVTDTPFEATPDYEETITDTRLSGAQEEIAAEGVAPAREPDDPKEQPTDPKWNEEHKGEQQQAAITGKPDLKEKEKEVSGAGSSTSSTTYAVHGDGPKRNKAREIMNKFNTRWGVRYGVTKEEFEEQGGKQPVKRRYA